jgi:hypothetical protein
MDVPHLDAKTVLQTTCRKEEETIYEQYNESSHDANLAIMRCLDVWRGT